MIHFYSEQLGRLEQLCGRIEAALVNGPRRSMPAMAPEGPVVGALDHYYTVSNVLFVNFQLYLKS